MADHADDDRSPIPAFYRVSAPAAPRTATLEGTLRVDAVIIGAGYTGLSAALHLAERKVSCAVLEMREIGWGASGRNFGQVVPYLKHDPGRVIRDCGRELGERLIDATARGPDLVFGLIERYRLECSAVRKGLIFAAHTPAGAAALERRAVFWQARGAPAEMLGTQQTQTITGTSYYRACLLERRGGTINPLGYARGLARAAIDGGARVFTDTRVEAIERKGPQWRVRTRHGEVLADSVVIATNAYASDSQWPKLRATVVPFRVYQAVSAPLAEDFRRLILPGGHALTDTRRLYSGIRMHPEGHLQASTTGPPFDSKGEGDVIYLTRRVQALYPSLHGIEWQERWAGWIAITYDQYPHLHELAPGLWTGLGCSGRGIAHMTMLGRDLANRIAGSSLKDCVFPVTRARPRVLAAVTPVLVRMLVFAYRALDGLDEWRYH